MTKIRMIASGRPIRPKWDLTTDARWRSYVRVEENGCWRWTGKLNSKGYGRFKIGGRNRAAHTWGYERWVGPIPEGLEPDHRCRNRWCVNPGCLEPVTHAENLRRRVFS